MQWDCRRGENCFNIKKRLKLGVFDDCFPRKISMTDLDAIVEIDGRFFVMEWKGIGVPAPRGQRLMFAEMCKLGFTVALVEGDAETMVVRSVEWWDSGKWFKPEPYTIDSLRSAISVWATR